jgi:hypothetical protein
VHSTYEDKMVDRFSQPLLAAIGREAKAGAGLPVTEIVIGQDAAFAVVSLMDFARPNNRPNRTLRPLH